jgi:hypothetical protein
MHPEWLRVLAGLYRAERLRTLSETSGFGYTSEIPASVIGPDIAAQVPL